MIRRSYYRAPSTESVAEVDRTNRGRTASMNGRASRCHHCSALQRTCVDGRPSQRRHLSGYPNDAWASRALIDWLLLFSDTFYAKNSFFNADDILCQRVSLFAVSMFPCTCTTRLYRGLGISVPFAMHLTDECCSFDSNQPISLDVPIPNLLGFSATTYINNTQMDTNQNRAFD